jgi:hypothetical protein
MRADIHDGPEHNTLQSGAGYIGAIPHIRQIDETLLQRTAGHARITAPQHFCPLHPNKQTRQDGLNAALCATS